MVFDFGRGGPTLSGGPGSGSAVGGDGAPRSRPGCVVGGTPRHGVPAGVGLPAPTTPSTLGGRAAVAQYTAKLRTDYQTTDTRFAAGVLDATALIDHVLLAAETTHTNATELGRRLARVCDDLFGIYRSPHDGYSAGVLCTAADLYIALHTWPAPFAHGPVHTTPRDHTYPPRGRA